eukprot:TRINITY_DN1250_c0_g1_i1.p1 TRINITY_DN1250_c0_g1~~TRINITY_DN1250_c0_g1_i1.p1  ORF type:complete len:106 (+),score=7.96 TRINITY_DN1250_c0_g1_i1:255-572(+)
MKPKPFAVTLQEQPSIKSNVSVVSVDSNTESSSQSSRSSYGFVFTCIAVLFLCCCLVPYVPAKFSNMIDVSTSFVQRFMSRASSSSLFPPQRNTRHFDLWIFLKI